MHSCNSMTDPVICIGLFWLGYNLEIFKTRHSLQRPCKFFTVAFLCGSHVSKKVRLWIDKNRSEILIFRTCYAKIASCRHVKSADTSSLGWISFLARCTLFRSIAQEFFTELLVADSPLPDALRADRPYCSSLALPVPVLM